MPRFSVGYVAMFRTTPRVILPLKGYRISRKSHMESKQTLSFIELENPRHTLYVSEILSLTLDLGTRNDRMAPIKGNIGYYYYEIV